MSEVAVQPKDMHPFYNGKFAWFPVGIFEKGDKHNSATIAARWLWFTVRDASAVNLDLSFDLDFEGVHLRIGLPYMNFHFRVEAPRTWSNWHWNNLYRKGSASKFWWQR